MAENEDHARNEYRTAVAETSRNPVVFIDPAKLDNLDAEKARAELRRQVDDQVQGFSSHLNNSELNDLIERSGQKGPAAFPVRHNDGSSSCIAIEPRKEFNKAAIGEFLSGIQASRLNLPGTDAQYSAAVGYHEGAHCNQPDFVDSNQHNSVTQSLLQLGKETGGDRVMAANADPAVAAAMLGLRALSVMDSSEPIQDHATKPFVNGTLPLNEKNMLGAGNFQSVVREGVYKTIGKDTGISPDEVAGLHKDQPELFRDVTQAMLDKGSFNDKPEQKVFAQDYVDAFNQLVKPAAAPEAAQTPESSGPQARINALAFNAGPMR